MLYHKALYALALHGTVLPLIGAARLHDEAHIVAVRRGAHLRNIARSHAVVGFQIRSAHIDKYCPDTAVPNLPDNLWCHS